MAASDALKKNEDMAGVALNIAKKANSRCHADDIGVLVVRLGNFPQPPPGATISATPNTSSAPVSSVPEIPAGVSADAADALPAPGTLASAGSTAAGDAVRRTSSHGPSTTRYARRVSQESVLRLASLSSSAGPEAAPESEFHIGDGQRAAAQEVPAAAHASKGAWFGRAVRWGVTVAAVAATVAVVACCCRRRR